MYAQVEKVSEKCLCHAAENASRTKEKKYNLDIVWYNVVLLTSLHIAGIYGLTLRGELLFASQIFMKLHLMFIAMGITAGHHRLWSHRAFKANTPLQLFLMLASSSTYQNSIYVWCRDHRVHHRFSDTDADPHNPKRGFFFSHVGWLMVRKHKDVIERGKTIDLSDLESNWIVMFQHKYYYLLVTIFAFVLPTLIPWYFWGESIKNAFLVIVIYKLILMLNATWLINSVAHIYGTRPYKKQLSAKESFWPFLLNFGEGFHNYHHLFPYDYKASEFDRDPRNITTCFIDFFGWLGWASDFRTVPEEAVKEWASKYGDGTKRYPAYFFMEWAIPEKYKPFIDKLFYGFWISVVVYFI